MICFKLWFNGTTSLAEFKNVAFMWTAVLKHALIGSIKWFKSMMLINAYSHFKQCHSDGNSRRLFQMKFFSQNSVKISFLGMMTSANSK